MTPQSWYFYIVNDDVLSQVFYTRLLPLLDQKAITVIFANIEDLLLTNTVSIAHHAIAISFLKLFVDFFEFSRRTTEGMPFVC